MALGKHLLVLALLAALVMAKGTLKVDFIVAIEGPIVVDALLGDSAEITGETAADTLGFGNFDEMKLTAPFLDFSASFFDVGATDTINFEAQDGDLNLSARHSVNVNGDRVNFQAGDDVSFSSDFGELSVIAGEEIVGEANSISVVAEAGGIAIVSEGHDVTVEADNSLFILSDEATGVINVEVTDDLRATGTSQVFVVANGDIDLNSRGKLIVDATDELNVVSSFGDLIFTAGDEVDVDVGGDLTLSSLDTTITSTTDGIEFHGFVSTQLDSTNGRLSIEGNSKGVTFTAPAAPISFTSTDDAVTFSAAGSGDQPGVYVRGNVDATVEAAFIIDAELEAQILGNSISVNADTVDVTVDALFSSSSDDSQVLSADAGSLIVESDQIVLAATDFNDQASLLAVSATTDVSYSGDEMRMFGHEFNIAAGSDDFVIDAADSISIEAIGTDDLSQVIGLTAASVELTGGDMTINGGQVGITSTTSTELNVAGNMDIATRERGRATVSIAGSATSITNLDGDFTLTDHLGSLEIHAEDNQAGDSSILFNGGDIELNAGTAQFQDDVEFEMTAHNEMTIASTGGNVASDVEFSSSDFVFQSSTSASFSATGDLDIDSDSDFYLEADSVEVADSGAVSFEADDYIYFITKRDPSTDDSITFNGPGTFEFNNEEIVFSSGGAATIGGGDDVIISGDDITVSSNNFSPITFDMSGTLVSDIRRDLVITGTHVTLDAFNDVSITTLRNIEFDAFERGYTVSTTVASMTFTSGNDFTVTSESGDITSSNFSPNSAGGPISFIIENDIDVDSTERTNVQSRDGSVNFVSGGNIDVDLGDDGILSTGDSVDDVFNIDARAELLFSSSLDTTVSGAGPLSFFSGGDTNILGSVVSFTSSEGIVDIEGTTSVTINSADLSDLTGGAIEIEATVTDVTVDGGSIAIENRESFIATEEVFGLQDDLIFTAENGDITFNAPNGQMEFNSDEFGLTSETSSVSLSGSSFTLDSNLLRQDIAFVAGGPINITVENDITQFAAGDFSIVAANYTIIDAEDVLFSAEADLTMAAVQGSILLNNTDGSVNFQVAENPNDASPVEEFTNIEFRATKEISGIATAGGIAFTSAGASQFRINEDGGRATSGATFNNAKYADTNGGLGSGPSGTLPDLVSQPVGFSIATRHADGNVILQSVFSDIAVASDNQEWITNGAASVTAGTSIDHVAGSTDSITLAADDGSLFGYALQGTYTLDVTDDLDIFATGSTDVLSNELVTFDVSGEVTFNIHSADLIFETFLQNNILISGRDLEFQGGSKGVHLIPQGDIDATSEGDTSIIGDRGVFMSTNTGPLNITSSELGNTVTAEEEISIHSGGDLLLSNTGNGNEDVRFNGVGVVFSTTQGPVQMTATGAALADAEAITLQSVGTSSTGRDRVLFDTNGNVLSFSGSDALIDATELFSVGLTTSPDVTFTAGGSAARDGIDINSAGNIDITSEALINFTPAGAFRSQSQSDAHISGFNGVTLESTTASVSFESVGGTLNFLADQQILIDATDIRLMSGGLMQLVQNSANDPIEFIITGDMEVISEGTLTNNVDEAALYEAGNGISITSVTNSGGHRLGFTVTDGDLTVDAANDISHTSGDILDVNAGADTTFESTTGYSVSTVGDISDISFTSLEDNIEINSVTFTSSSDRAIFSATSSDSPGTIELDIEDATLTALGNSFGTAAKQGNIITEAVAEVEIEGATGLFTITDSAIAIAREDVSVTAVGPLTVTTAELLMVTEEHRGGEITIGTAGTTTNLDINVATEDAFFNAADEIDIRTAVTDITATNDDITFTSFGASHEPANINVESTAGFTFDPPGSLFISAGSGRYSGDIAWEIGGAFTFTGEQVFFGAALDPYHYYHPGSGGDSIEHTIVSPDINLLADDDIVLSAFNSIDHQGGFPFDTEAGYGYIEFTTSDFEAVGDDVLITALNAGVSMATADMTFTATSANITTQGIDSGIFFDALDFLDFSNALGLVSAEMAANNRFIAEAVDLNVLAPLLSIRTVGPGGANDVGIEFLSDETVSVFSGTTEDVSADFIRYHSDSVHSISIGGSMTVSASTVSYRTEGFGTDSGVDELVLDTGLLTITATESVSFEADRNLEVTGASLTFSNGALPMRQLASGDIYIEGRQGATYTTPANMRFLSDNSGVELANLAHTITVGDELNIFSGVDETSNSINFVGTLGSAPSPIVTFTSNANIRNELHNNYLSETSFQTVVAAAIDLNFIARKGSQLFRSVTLDAFQDGEQLAPAETHVQAVGGGIEMEAHYFIRHRQHQFLDFFVGQNQPSHTRPSAPQQRTTNDMTSITVRQACVCSSSANIDCSNVACPETYNRVRQMQRALLDMGLLRF